MITLAGYARTGLFRCRYLGVLLGSDRFGLAFFQAG